MFICHVQKEDGKLPDNHTIKIKISGDGARMTKLTNYVILSFCILNGSEDVLSAKGDFMTNLLMRITLITNALRLGFLVSHLKQIAMFCFFQLQTP